MIASISSSHCSPSSDVSILAERDNDCAPRGRRKRREIPYAKRRRWRAHSADPQGSSSVVVELVCTPPIRAHKLPRGKWERRSGVAQDTTKLLHLFFLKLKVHHALTFAKKDATLTRPPMLKSAPHYYRRTRRRESFFSRIKISPRSPFLGAILSSGLQKKDS